MPRLGETLAQRYSLVEQLGAGGMGVVYRAHDSFLKRDVAIKLVPPERLTDDSRHRFLTEARIVAGMDHPSIVPVYDFGEHEGSMFFVMPVVEGMTLSELLRGRALRVREAVEIIHAVADVLAFAHERGIVHRDIKPENIMVSEVDGDLRVRVMDFGLARRIDAQQITQVGVLVGTLHYLSPEQVAGKAADAASDLYALGTVFYECLARDVPFSGPTDSLLYRIVNEYPMPLRERGIEVDEQLEMLVLRCLAKDPLERPNSAKSLAKLLRRYLREGAEFRDAGSVRRLPPRTRRDSDAMVGRSEQMASLQLMLNRMLAGHGQICVVAGDEGVGKTRLVHAFAKFAAARGVRPLHGRLVEHEGAFPYFGFGTLILEFFRTLDSSSSGAPRPRLDDLAPRLMSLFPMLGELTDFRGGKLPRDSSPSVHPREDSSAENRIKLYEVLATTFLRLSQVRPLLLIFEDLHLADSSVQALQYIARRIGAHPIMMLLTYRVDATDRRHPFVRMIDGFRDEQGFTRLLLRPFTAPEQQAFLDNLLGGRGVDPGLTKRLYEIAEGNPFFTKELALALQNAGDIAKNDDDIWVAVDGLMISSEAMPATVQQAVRARIERLDSRDRRVLSAASVLGKSFEFGDLEVVVRLGEELEDVVERLLDSGLIEEERRSRSDRLSFTSGIVREVLYGELTRRRRRRLHRQYAEHLESSRRGRLDQVYAQLFFHYAAADVPDKAMDYGLAHTQQLLDAYSAEEAIRVCRAALEFVDEDDGETTIEGQLRESLATALHTAGQKDAALREVGRAIEQFQICGDRPSCLRGLAFAARVAWETRKTAQARRHAEQGLALAGELGESEIQAELLTLAATLASIRGEHARATAYLKLAQQCQDTPDDTVEAVAPKAGGHLVVALSEPFVSAGDPCEVRFIHDVELLANVFEPLMTTDERGHLVPHLCEHWEVEQQGKQFVLHLRPDVMFHDGSAMRAEHVIASLQRLARVNSAGGHMALSPILGMSSYLSHASDQTPGLRLRDPLTVVIELERPLPIYLASLSLLYTSIVHQTDDGVVGTGPFVLKSHTPSRTKLVRNPNYWTGKPARIDALTFMHVGDSAEVRQRLLIGDVDIANELHPNDIEGLLREPAFEVSTIEEPEKVTFFAVFNTKSSDMARHRAVRQAMCGVVDTQKLIWQTLGRYGLPASGVLPPGVLGHDAGWRTNRLSHEAARELLRRHVDGPIRVRVMVHPVIVSRYQSVLDELFSVWRQLGIEIVCDDPDMAAFDDCWSAPQGVDVMIARWGGGTLDPDYYTHNLFSSEHGMLRAFYAADVCDRLFEQGRAEREPQRRVRYYREVEEELRREGVLLPLFHAVDIRIAAPCVVGAKLGGAPPYLNYASIAKQHVQAPVSESWTGGVCRVPMGEEIDALDPTLSVYAPYVETMGCIFETLTRIDEGGRVLPWLAESCEPVDGGRSYRITLRDGVRFHDGRPLRARDVRYTLERMLKRTEINDRRLFTCIRGGREVIEGTRATLAGVVVHSPYVCTIELEQPLSYFAGLLAHRMVGIVPEGSDLRPGATHENVVGTGPFRVVSFEPKRRLRLERNPTYWRPGYPKCQALEFYFNVGSSEQLEGFHKGLFTVVGGLPPDEHTALLRDPKLARGYTEIPALSTYYIAFNCHHGPMADVAQRRRMCEVIGQSAYLGASAGRLLHKAHGLIPPGLLGHDSHREVGLAHALSPHDSPTLQPLSLVALAHPVFQREHAAIMERIVATLERAGIHLEVVHDVSEWRDRDNALQSFDLLFTRWFADFIDSHTFTQLLLTTAGYVGPICGSPELDELIGQGQIAANPQARHRIYTKFEDTLREQARILPLFNEHTYRFIRPEFRGAQLSLGHLMSYDQVELRTGE